MNISEKEYDEKIKPFFDKLYNIALSNVENILIGDFILELMKNEFDFEALKQNLSNITKLQEDFLISQNIGKELSTLKDLLKE